MGNFNLVSDYSAVQLKLNHIQVLILNFYIINWLADNLQKYDENNPANQLFYINVFNLSKYFNIPKCYLKYNIDALTKIITCLDGTRIQIMYRNKKHRGLYVGMELSIIHKLVNKECFNNQCVFHNKPKLKCLITIENKKENDFIINDMKKPLLVIEDKNNNKWAEDIIYVICLFAKKSDTDVFNHLSRDNNFRKRRKLIDNAINYLREIDEGTFTKVHGVFFNNIPAHVLEVRRIDYVIKKIKQLKGNRDAIQKVIINCVKNYLISLTPGMDTPEYYKNGWQKNIDKFLLFDDNKGNVNPNFMLFYFAPDTAEQQVLENVIENVRNKSNKIYMIAADYTSKINKYENDVKTRKVYWQNILKLYNHFEKLKKSNLTSYQIQTCFDFVFKQSDVLFEKYKLVNKGSFDFDSVTIKKALSIIKNK